MSSTIEFTLKGLLAIFVNPDNKECTVGLLRETPPHHEFKISVSKSVAGGEYEPFAEIKRGDIQNLLRLDVKNTSKTGISRRKDTTPIDRINGAMGGNNDSFLWVADFERDFYHKPVGARKAGFISILTLNNGELLTRELSTNKLLTRKEGAVESEEFGFVACETGIDIILDQPTSSAVFTNGGKEIFRADSESSYKVFIDRGPLPTHDHPNRNDADFYYTALGHLIPDPEKIFFSSTPPPVLTGPQPPATPDAACFNGGGGGSHPS